jgi:N-formylglutamate amidohydrolase
MKNVKTRTGNSFLVVASIHSGHRIRPQLLSYLKLSETERLLEEDPFTDKWITISDNQIRVLPSRFEVDVNRPREKAIYMNPKDAWGLEVWNEKLPEEIVEKSLQVYDEIYTQLAHYFDALLSTHKYLIIYDLHSYNHRREGFDQYANPAENPEINIGTGNLNRDVWGTVVDELINQIRSFNFEGRHLSVGENVKFRGGHFSKWLHARYKDLVCPVSIEVKKFFMNEWTGEVFEPQLTHLRELLISTIAPVTMQSKKIHL